MGSFRLAMFLAQGENILESHQAVTVTFRLRTHTSANVCESIATQKRRQPLVKGIPLERW